MRILILSQYFDPEPIPKPGELARALRANGDDVTVITGFPNYPSGVLAEGYRLELVNREVVDGITTIRTYEFPYHGKSVVGRFLNYCSFMVSAPIGALFASPVDAMYVWHPPLTIGVAAALIARMRGIPILYDVQDLWPDSVVLAGLMEPGLGVRALSLLERFVYRAADHLIVVTEGAKRIVTAKGIPAEKISVMPHWIDNAAFVNRDPAAAEHLRTRFGWDKKFILLFAGNLGIVQGLETIVRAARQLDDLRNVRFVFVGDGAAESALRELVSTLDLEEAIQFLGRQPAERMPDFLAAADALIVHLKASPLAEVIIPTKTLAYLASGTPIIMAMQGAAAELVAAAGAGEVIPADDSTALANAVRRMVKLPLADRQAMGRRGAAFAAANLAIDVVIPQYYALMQKLVHAKKRGA